MNNLLSHVRRMLYCTLHNRVSSVVLIRFCFAGEVVLVDIEDSSSVHKLNMSAEVTALSWAAHVPEEPTKEETMFAVSVRKEKESCNLILIQLSVFVFITI